MKKLCVVLGWRRELGSTSEGLDGERGKAEEKRCFFLHGTVGWLRGTLYQLICGNYGDNQNAVG